MQILLKDILKETIQASGETMQVSDFRKTSQGYEAKLGFRKQFQMLKDLINSNKSETAIAEELNNFFHRNTVDTDKSIAMLSMATNVGQNLLFFAMTKNPAGPILRIILDWKSYYDERQKRKSVNEALEEKSPLKIQIYLDMDGVLVDMEKGFKELSDGLSIEDYTKKNGPSSFWKLIATKPNFWIDLKPMPDARVLWEFIQKNFKDPVPVILSAGQEEAIKSQKKQWISNNIDSSVKVIIAPSGKDKARFALNLQEENVNHVLIDDNGPADIPTDVPKDNNPSAGDVKKENNKKVDNITAWNKVPKHNGIHHKNAADTIRILSKPPFLTK